MIHKKGSPPGGVLAAAATVLVALPVLACAAAPTALFSLSGDGRTFVQAPDAVHAADTVAPLRGLLLAQAGAVVVDDVSGGAGLKFEIRSYRVEGNTLLPLTDVERLLRAYTGKSRDFGDVQQALEALQALYTERGYAGIQITLPEQELDRGDVIFR